MYIENDKQNFAPVSKLSPILYIKYGTHHYY